MPPSGSVIISVFGVNFGGIGRSMNARISFSGQEFTLWTSDSSFACRSPSGSFASAAIFASTSGSVGFRLKPVTSSYSISIFIRYFLHVCRLEAKVA